MNSSKLTTFLLLLFGFIVGVLAYWLNSYNDLNVLGIHIYIILSVGSFIAAFAGMTIFKKKSFFTSVVINSGILIAVLFRIFFDIEFIDSSHHNLFPFEIIIVLLIAFPSALIGAYLSYFLKKLKKY